ncbi:MAG: hypothetical protein WDM89_18045 [Rhizomicrobium sp.]
MIYLLAFFCSPLALLLTGKPFQALANFILYILISSRLRSGSRSFSTTSGSFYGASAFFTPSYPSITPAKSAACAGLLPHPAPTKRPLRFFPPK